MEWEKVSFKGEDRFLSNMFECNIQFCYMEEIQDIFDDKYFDDNLYKSSEHIYMAMKSNNFIWHKIICSIHKPTQTKKIASLCLIPQTNIITEGKFFIRNDFDNLKIDLMRRIIYLKFLQNEDLAQKLIDYQGYIEEKNCWNDVFWGTCNGIGENHLGKILMEVRNFLLEKKDV